MRITSENAITVIGKFKQLQRQVWVWHPIQNNITSFNTNVFFLECIPTVIPWSGWWELSHRKTGNIEEDGCLPHQVGHLDNLNAWWGDEQWTYLGLVALQMVWVWRNNYFPCQHNASSISPLLFKNYSWIDVSSKSQNWRWWVQGGAINMSFSEAFRDSQKGDLRASSRHPQLPYWPWNSSRWQSTAQPSAGAHICMGDGCIDLRGPRFRGTCSTMGFHLQLHLMEVS